MFHYLNQMKFDMLKSSKIRKHYEANYHRRNIVRFADRLFFWEDKGRSIERLECTIKKEEKTYLYKVYDAKNVIKMCKKTHYIPNVECLIISDEDKYLKILSYDSINKKLKVEKEFYVEQFFAIGDDLSSLESLQYTNNILYNNHEAYLLQERGTERGDMSLEVTA